jgi:hypothetical protein
VGLIGAIIAGRALARRGGSGSPQSGASVGIVAGLIGIAVGGLVVATSPGGVGTGNGRGGAIVAVVVGLISVVLGGLARQRR